jgi:phosphonoacetaldehyde hydrolase
MKNIELIIFDWAGTLVDFGCRAPLGAFHAAFKNAGLPISDEIARKPMGAHKRDHVREILTYPEIAERVRADLKREPDHELIDLIYNDFALLLPPMLSEHAEPIPGVVEVLHELRSRNIRIGSTTGYTRAMMDVLAPIAKAAGVEPEFIFCSDEVPQSRPAPWACFRIAEACGVYPMSHCLKVGDTPSDMAEGRNAGMICVGVSESGNETGLSREALAALDVTSRKQLIDSAELRLLDAGAHAVIRSVADLPRWLEMQLV